MFARHVSMELRPNSRIDFTHKIESEILPLLHEQKGFQDEITFVDPAGKGAFAVSLWDSKESAEAYSCTTFAEVTRLLAKVVERTPKVRSYEVANSTAHNIAAQLEAAWNYQV